MTQTQHTPLPWRAVGTVITTRHGENDGPIADTRSAWVSAAGCEANAQFICRAVNSHADLRAACETALGVVEGCRNAEESRATLALRAALAKVREG